MTLSADPNNRWLSIYVPKLVAGGGAPVYESYLRLGSPDGTTESAFLNTLRADYQSSLTETAVRAAFGASPTSGVTLYTGGDLVQFIQGKSDTRVLNDSYVVHVLNKVDEDKTLSPSTGKVVKTTRAYLRLGKPSEVEKQLAEAAPAQLKDLILALAPAAPSPIDDAAKQAKKDAALGGSGAPGPGETPSAATVTSVQTARASLLDLGKQNDAVAVDALEQLRVSADARADIVYDGATTHDWALSALQAAHLALANGLRDKAIQGDTDARTRLSSRAAAGDPMARRKLAEIAEGTNTQAASWAKGALDAAQVGSDMLAQFSLGDGVALYADRPITMTTPSTLKVTVGADSRSVLGPTYAETYDVSDADIAAVRSGAITQVGQIGRKKLITASLTQRSSPSWRTIKFDQAKALTYSLSDSGSFGITSSYAFAFGLKLTNGIAGSFDGSLGVSVSVPSSFKVELGKSRLETSWSGGKLTYSKAANLTGNNVRIAVDKVETFSSFPASEVLAKVTRIGMIAVNGLVLAYTAIGVGIGDSCTGPGDESTRNVREYLAAGEPVYIAVSVLNAIFAAAGIIVGVIQLAGSITSQAAAAASPAQLPNIVLNDDGIKLQCGTSFIAIDPTGIAISSPQVYMVGPITNVVPAYMTGNLTPTGIAQALALAQEGIPMMDLFGELL